MMNVFILNFYDRFSRQKLRKIKNTLFFECITVLPGLLYYCILFKNL